MLLFGKDDDPFRQAEKSTAEQAKANRGTGAGHSEHAGKRRVLQRCADAVGGGQRGDERV